jgi:uncharacterized coiled-coil protein SlyX
LTSSNQKDFFDGGKSDIITQDRIKDLEQHIHHLEATVKNLEYKLATQTAPLENPELVQNLKDLTQEVAAKGVKIEDME